MDHEDDTVEFPPPPTPAVEAPRPVPRRVEVDLGARSHPGKVRPNNEDFYLVGRARRTLTTLLTNLPPDCVPGELDEVAYGMVVADGIGGMAAGEVASRNAISSLIHLIVQNPAWILRTGPRENQELMARIAQRFREVNAALRADARADPNLAGMGTTMTLAMSLGAELFIGHVGDSRLYLRHGGTLYRLTRDHTYAQAMADAGAIPAEEVGSHRLRHVLTRSLGANVGQVEADLERVTVGEGDQVLLCTDGLSDLVDDAAIAAALGRPGTSDQLCQALVDLALDRGGRDNVTVVLARYHFPQPA